MLAYGKVLSEFWGLPFTASSVATEAQKSCTKLAKCQKSKLFFAFSNHIFFSLLFIAFSVYSTGHAARGGKAAGRKDAC